MGKNKPSNEFTLGQALILAIISFGIYKLLFVKNQRGGKP